VECINKERENKIEGPSREVWVKKGGRYWGVPVSIEGEIVSF